MFHTIFVLSIMLIVPSIFTFAEVRLKKRAFLDCLCKWFVFWAVGVRASTAGLMQIINPSYTMELLHIGNESLIVITELGCAQLAIGVLGLISLKNKAYLKSAVLSYGIFMLGASTLHFTRLSVIDLGEVISLIGDLIVVCVALITLTRKTK